MDDQELQRLMQQALEEIRTLGAVSAETAKKIDEAGDSMADFKKTAMALGAQFTRTMTNLVITVGAGNTEFTVFNSVVDSVTGALTEMGKAIPFFGAAMVAAGEGAKFLLGQLQATTKAFNEVGAAGLLGAEGMTGLRDQFVEAGIDLQLYTKVVTANSEALARFGGTADQGAARFSKALGQVNRDFGHQLMSLGNSFDAIAEQTAGYMALQTRLGRSQNMTQDQLAKGAFEYAKQLDALAKLTGQSKNELQKQQDAMLSETRFRARIQELENQGRGDAARRLRELALVTGQLGPGFRDIIAAGGAITTDAAREIAQSTNFAATRIVQQVEAGMDPGEAARQLQAGTQAFVSANTSILKFTGDIPGFVSNFATVVDFSTREFRTLGEAAGTAARQMGAPDALTASAVDAQKAMQQFSNAVSNFATNLLPIAGDAVAKFAQVTADGINKIQQKLNEYGAGRPVAVPRPQFAEGGIARGPESGFPAMLHGIEAVVPLPDGATIPVDVRTANLMPMNQGLVQDLAKQAAMELAKNKIPGLNDLETIRRAAENPGAGNIADVVRLLDPAVGRTLGLAVKLGEVANENTSTTDKLLDVVGVLVPKFAMLRVAFDQLQKLVPDQALADVRSPQPATMPGMETTKASPETNLAGTAMAVTDDRLIESNQQMVQVLQELVSLQRTQNSTSNKILQASTN